jgi:hypothetical protein
MLVGIFTKSKFRKGRIMQCHTRLTGPRNIDPTSMRTRIEGRQLSPLFLLIFFLVPIQGRAGEADKVDTLESQELGLVSDEEKVDALELHGLALYQRELFDEAAEAFRRLLKIRPNQHVYFNIGQCDLMRKRYDLALEAFTVYLASDTDKISKKRLEYTKDVVKEITKVVGVLDIRGKTPMEVWIDDELRGKIPLGSPLYVLKGEHRLVFKRDDEIVQTETYAVKPGETITIQAPYLAPKPKSKSVGPSQSGSEPESAEKATGEATPNSSETPTIEKSVASPQRVSTSSPLRNAGIFLAGIGGAAVIGSVITGSVALSKNKELTDNCPDKEQTCSDSNRDLQNSVIALGVATNVLLPIGGTILVTGVTLAIIGHRKTAKQTESRTKRPVSIVPYGAPNMAGMLIEGRF